MDSAFFMKVYIYVAVWAIGLTVVGAIITALYMACSGSGKEEGYEKVPEKNDNEAGEQKERKRDRSERPRRETRK